MSKTIIISEDVLKSGVLDEIVETNQLPDAILQDVLVNKTPLSNNPAIPDDVGLEKLVLLSYKHSLQKDIPNGKIEKAKDAISKIVKETQEIERPIRNNLEQLICEKVVNLLNVPSEAVDFSLTLEDEISQSETMIPFGPNEAVASPYYYTDIAQQKTLVDEASKRKMINVLVAGAAQYYTKRILDESAAELDEFNGRLYDLYCDYLAINEHLLFCDKEINITEENKGLVGTSIVELGNDDTKNRLVAKGTTFPILVYETIKGFLEMCVAHGLPEDRRLADEVLSISDYLSAEPWNMRLGTAVWSYFNRAANNAPANTLPYVLMKISKLDTEKFSNLMKGVFQVTPQASMVLERVVKYAIKKNEHAEFNKKMDTLSNSLVVINDDEKLLNENVTDIVYHFTCSWPGIVHNDCFYFRCNDSPFPSKSNPKDYPYYMSVTRSKNSRIGYALKFEGASQPLARLMIDGRMINQSNLFRGSPFNFFYDAEWNGSESPSPKQHYHNFLNGNKRDSYPTAGYDIFSHDRIERDNKKYSSPDRDEFDASFRVQSEDRIYTKVQRLDDFHKYVLRMDILLNGRSRLAILTALKKMPGIDVWKDKIYFYEEVRDFDMQNDKGVPCARLIN